MSGAHSGSEGLPASGALDRPSLADLLERSSADGEDLRALLVLAKSSHDPTMAPFVGEGRLGSCLVVWPLQGEPRLGYFSPMERGEAARSGLELLTPEALDVQRFARSGDPAHVFFANVASRALQLCGVAAGSIAITGSQPAGRLSAALPILEAEGWSFQPGESIVELMRKEKAEFEIEGVRRAAAGTVEAFRRIAAILSASSTTAEGSVESGTSSADPARAETADGAQSDGRDLDSHPEALFYSGLPLTVGVLRRAVARVFAEHGLEQPERNIVAPAEEGALPHSLGTDSRQLRQGQSLVVDLFPRGRLFADCTRTFCVGDPPAALEDGHRQVTQALQLAEALARPGVTGWSLQQAVCERLAADGWPTPIDTPGTVRGYVHGLGHGVGYELHELPSFGEFSLEEEGTLKVGDIITLEPGLYEPEPEGEAEGWAVRVEDLYLVTADGVENLTPIPRHLDPRRW